MVLSFRKDGRQTVDASDVIALMGCESSARRVINTLLRKGWFMRLTPGHYLFIPPERGPENLGENNALAVASAVVSPTYVGWWAAAAYHGFTTQKPAAIATATKRSMPKRTIEGAEISFVQVAPRKFFGFQSYDVYGRPATISTPAKTVADCLDRPTLAGGPSEVARIAYGASSEIPADEVADVALQMKSTSLIQRLGFIMDLVAWTLTPTTRAKMRSMIGPSTRSVFGRPEARKGDIGYVPEWSLLVHASRSDLLTDVPPRQRAVPGRRGAGLR